MPLPDILVKCETSLQQALIICLFWFMAAKYEVMNPVRDSLRPEVILLSDPSSKSLPTRR